MNMEVAAKDEWVCNAPATDEYIAYGSATP